LAGHEKYIKTTVFGMLGHMPDYCFLVIAANVGVKGTTREHLLLSITMKIPLIVIITKIDICSDKMLQNTLNDVKKLLTLYKKEVILITEDILQESIDLISDNPNYIPIFQVSNVTGQNLSLLIKVIIIYHIMIIGLTCMCSIFIFLPPKTQWNSLSLNSTSIFIAESFPKKNEDYIVLGGIITAGSVKAGDIFNLGPNEMGKFKRVKISSIHLNRVPVSVGYTGQYVTVAVTDLLRSEIRKGMVLLDLNIPDIAVWTFEAKVQIINSSSPINKRFQPMIQCMTFRQCAIIEEIQGSNDFIEKGETAIITLKFLYRPEYINVGMNIIFGEGKTKGIGVITRVLPIPVLTSPINDNEDIEL